MIPQTTGPEPTGPEADRQAALDADQLAALLGSRLCHDLVSPLGAIGNGVELLQMSSQFPGLAQSPEMQLIQESVNAAQQRIRAFRMAFGHASRNQRISRVELGQLTDEVAAHGRVHIRLEAEGDFARVEIRLVMLAVMCLESAMPWGGRILVVHTAPGWRLLAESDRLKPDAALWAWLDAERPAGMPAPAPADIHFALLAEAVPAAGRRLYWEMDEAGAEIRF